MRAEKIDFEHVDIAFLKQEFSRLQDELTGMKEQLSDRASETLAQMGAYLNGQNAHERLAGLEAELKTLKARMADGGKEAVQRLETQVSARPLASVAIAFGVGLLAAQMLRRG